MTDILGIQTDSLISRMLHQDEVDTCLRSFLNDPVPGLSATSVMASIMSSSEARSPEDPTGSPPEGLPPAGSPTGFMKALEEADHAAELASAEQDARKKDKLQKKQNRTAARQLERQQEKQLIIEQEHPPSVQEHKDTPSHTESVFGVISDDGLSCASSDDCDCTAASGLGGESGDGYGSDTSVSTRQGSRTRTAYLIGEGEDGQAVRLAFGEVRLNDGVFIIAADGVSMEGAEVDIADRTLAEMAGEMVPLIDLDAAELGFEWTGPEEGMDDWIDLGDIDVDIEMDVEAATAKSAAEPATEPATAELAAHAAEVEVCVSAPVSWRMSCSGNVKRSSRQKPRQKRMC